MTSRIERRLERVEEKLGQGRARTSPEVRAYVGELFGQAIDITPQAQDSGEARAGAYVAPDWTDPALYAHLEGREAHLTANPAMRRFYDVAGWPEWNGKEWVWPEYTPASGEQTGALARSYENAKPKDDLLPPQPSAAEGPLTDHDRKARH